MNRKYWILVVAVGLVLLILGVILKQCKPPATSTAAKPESSVSIMQPVNLGPVINTKLREAEASFTADGKTMYFNCEMRKGSGGNDICVSYLIGPLEEGQWSTPQIVAPGVISRTDTFEVEPIISPDGKTLFFMGSGRLGGIGGNDIWFSENTNEVWQLPKSLDPPINGVFDDHCFFLSTDGNEAFWTSTRPGGFGRNDIWTAKKVDGVWQKAVNLGKNVNSKYSEHHSVLSPDGKSLYVTSSRPGGLGADDIYVTTRDNFGLWSPLVNLGSPVNSDKNDRCASFTPDFRFFVFDSDRVGGHGSKDLWWVYYDQIKHIR